MHGSEWVVDARGCDAAALRNVAAVRDLISTLVAGLGLHPVAEPVWHRFPETDGLTALFLLAESHIAVHTFPEHASLCLNVFCCRPREEFDFERGIREHFAAAEIVVRRIERHYGSVEQAAV